MPAGKEFITPVNFEFGQRRIQSECGLIGVFHPGHDVIEEAYVGGTDLQHRAEGGAGMFASNGFHDDTVRELGTIAVAFQEGRHIPQVDSPHIAVLHTRYPTAGRSNHRANIQPLSKDGITLGHHGNLTNALELKERLGSAPNGDKSPDSDSWLALSTIAKASGTTLGEKVVNAQKNFEGAWALIVTDGKQMVVSRDPHGIRPLSLGYIGDEKKPEGFVVSVETAPFANLKVSDFREVLPGETLVIDDNGVRTIDLSPKNPMSCIFEFVYMMRPDSVFMGERVYMTRRRAGEILWKEQPVDVGEFDHLVVMPIPNSGRPSAIGYFNAAREELGTRVSYDEALLANPYFGRNFIKAEDKRNAFRKFYGIAELIKGVKVATVDDSKVRADTSRDNARVLREYGVDELHDRMASPPVAHPCFWGVAFSENNQLIANKIPDLSERAKYIGVDSIGYLSMGGLFESVGMNPQEIRAALEKNERKFCTHCFDGFGPEMKNKGIIPLSELQRATA